MMNRIMKTGGASVALAAAALLAAPAASADKVHRGQAHGGATVSVSVGTHAHVHKAHHRGGYAYDAPRSVRRNAIRQCRAAIRNEGYARGFRDVDFDDRRVRQVGPAGFVVRFEAEFEGRRREFERNVRCEVRRGRIVALDGVPYPGRGRAYGSGYSDRFWRGYDDRHRGHTHNRGAYCPADEGYY